MRYRALENFTCYPKDLEANRLDIKIGTEVDTDKPPYDRIDEEYAALLVSKGHLEEIAAPAFGRDPE